VNDRGFLLDTNVVSELVRTIPHARVLAWIRRQRPTELFLAAVTLGEIVRGVVRLPTGSRRSRLEAWATESLPRQFAGRILAFDQQAAVIWGELMGTADRTGRPRAAADPQIAATAIRHDLIVVTRNTGDFEDLTAALENPWD
jgi:predicted nucleic acid-binding protein